MDGRELAARRRERGLTQAQLAALIESVEDQTRRRFGQGALGIDRSMIGQLETGRKPIPHKPRDAGIGHRLPSIHDELERVLSLPDGKLRELIEDAPRGPYRRSSN